ncbi:MAG: signal peptidase I [Clostridia bacterium]|nr:signal peptidase I [Clostridia bacterium]
MSKDKKVLYATSFIIFAVFFAALFVDMGSSKIVAAILLLPITPAVWFLIRKRSSLSIYKREVLLLSIVIPAIYTVLLHVSGLFFGYYKNPYFVNADIILKYVLPLAVIIVGSEIIRYVLLAQRSKLAAVMSFLICIVLEVLMLSSIPGIRTFNKFMDLVGMTLFPALSANVYYHYVSKNFGALPNIAFRMITTLYIYFVPTAAAMPDALSACIKILLPILLLAFISALYSKEKKKAVRKGNKLGIIATVLTVIVLIASAMLISCQFRFGALVIATESMTGEINKGDIIIYERYDSQHIVEGQVIVFKENKSKIVHRVVDIQNIGGEIRYYTKGDANEDWDSGYRTREDILGTTDIKISYAGYPTLWLRALLKGRN